MTLASSKSLCQCNCDHGRLLVGLLIKCWLHQGIFCLHLKKAGVDPHNSEFTLSSAVISGTWMDGWGLGKHAHNNTLTTEFSVASYLNSRTCPQTKEPPCVPPLTLPMLKLKCLFDRSHPNQQWALWLLPAGSSLTLYPSGFPYPELSSLERQGGPGAITERGTGVIWLGTPYHTHTPYIRGREGLWTLNNVSLGLFGRDRRPNEKHYNWPKTSDLPALQTKHVGRSHGQGQSHVTPPCWWSKWVGKDWGNPSSCS